MNRFLLLSVFTLLGLFPCKSQDVIVLHKENKLTGRVLWEKSKGDSLFYRSAVSSGDSLLLFVPLLLDAATAAGGGWRPWPMVCFILVIWANDVFAYLVGSSLGRHPLCKRISPNKSWEGFFGGIAGAVGVALAASWLLGADMGRWAGLAAVASLTGVAGDLVESKFKRAAGVKDSGRILPGHGGWLDRFDAMILSAPYVLVYLILVK